MNLNRFYFTMTLILVTILLVVPASAIQQLDNEGPIYGECKYYTETVIEDGVEVSKKETRVCDETKKIGENPDDVDYLKIHLIVDTQLKQIMKLKQFGNNLTESEYVIKEFSPTNIDDNTFILNTSNFPGFDIVDLR